MLRKWSMIGISIGVAFMMAACTNEASPTEGTADQPADAVSAQKWEQSPLFTSGSYTMIGEEGRLGFIYDDSEVLRFYPDKQQKYMWHFWGESEELKGNLKVVGTHAETDEQITVIEGIDISGALNGADAHTPSLMSLPKSGMWKLDAFIGDRLFGSVFVEVHE